MSGQYLILILWVTVIAICMAWICSEALTGHIAAQTVISFLGTVV